MFKNRLSALNPFFRIFERFIKGGSCQTRKNHAHTAVDPCQVHSTKTFHDGRVRNDHPALWHLDIVKKDLPLVQGTLSDFVQRFSPRDARQIQPNGGKTGSLHPFIGIQGDMETCMGGYGSVTDPGRFLAVDDILLPL